MKLNLVKKTIFKQKIQCYLIKSCKICKIIQLMTTKILNNFLEILFMNQQNDLIK